MKSCKTPAWVHSTTGLGSVVRHAVVGVMRPPESTNILAVLPFFFGASLFLDPLSDFLSPLTTMHHPASIRFEPALTLTSYRWKSHYFWLCENGASGFIIFMFCYLYFCLGSAMYLPQTIAAKWKPSRLQSCHLPRLQCYNSESLRREGLALLHHLH